MILFGNLLCIASSKWAFIDIQKNSISKITEELILLYTPEEKTVFGETDIAKFKVPEIKAPADFTFQVGRKDIDVNHHMHNTYYLNYAYEAFPLALYEADEPNNFEILYKTGAKLRKLCRLLLSSRK
ncbi:MAG: hypothetical protein HFJ28_05205 [Clostridia bacterium]|nr:hypothetical protein [Clostridia bacterium]